jgi:hypothetical protein
MHVSAGQRPICSVPPLPTHTPALASEMPAFNTYAAEWSRRISSKNATPMTDEPLIRKMFTKLKDYYTELSTYVPEVTSRAGKHAFLHRARVAREQEDVISFREIRTELVGYWNLYLAREEQKKKHMRNKLTRMMDMDMYPSHEWENNTSSVLRVSGPEGSSAASPVILLDEDAKNRRALEKEKEEVQAGRCCEKEAQTQNLRQLQQEQLNMLQRQQWRFMQEQQTQEIMRSLAVQELASPRNLPPQSDTHTLETKKRKSTLAEEYSDSSSNSHSHSNNTTPLRPSFSSDVYTYAHALWPQATETGDPGPSTKRRCMKTRLEYEDEEALGQDVVYGDENEVKGYVGKGKGRMKDMEKEKREVIWVDSR